MKKLALFSGLLGVSLSLIACGGDGTGSTSTAGAGGEGTSTAAATTGAGGAGTTTTAAGTTASSTSATGTGGGAPAPDAPIMLSAEKLGGALHVTWKNVTAGCDKIELSRKHDAGAYAVAYTLNGSATSQHDTQAVPPGMYCYMATCMKGGQMSVSSNEKCGTP
ncbi:MAG: hypothetical protein ABJE95_25705 [Byssovorax sp.]